MPTPLLERLETHMTLGQCSPGFHLSEADMTEIVTALREVERLRFERDTLVGDIERLRTLVETAFAEGQRYAP
jgi:hypothetical protein